MPDALDASTFCIGSRESELALIQTHYVRQLLESKYPDSTFTINAMTTTGDQQLSVALSKIGSKALFTKELEIALQEGRVDFVVHSLKDCPTSLPEGMVLGAILERESPWDVVVFKQGSCYKTLAELPKNSVVGTSSVRRVAELQRHYPHLLFQDVRGNLNTRLKKLDDPALPYSCLILAYAGLHRLGWNERIGQVLDLPYAVGQGALAIECRQDDTKILNLLQPLNHVPTRIKCLAERGFMKQLEGGCSVPLGVKTELVAVPGSETNFELILTGCVSALDGSECIQETQSKRLDLQHPQVESEAADLGTQLALRFIQLGAKILLDKIRQ